MASDPLALRYDFSRLSLAELLQARDTYHFHLLNKPNVVGTAIGLYLIRKEEPWPTTKGAGTSRVNKPKGKRTLANSEVRDYSWPCVLALVRKWEDEEKFSAGGSYDPSQIVPKTLYMADGRAVPVCVVEAHEAPPSASADTLSNEVPPGHMFGGGLPICVTVQGATYCATAGCLVSDGHLTYALTARHVCGEEGTRVTSRLRGGEVPVGESSSKQLTRRLFSEVYPDFQGRRSYCSLDVGLIRVDDVDAWTSNTYGLPPLGPLADVHEHNLTLRLIDQKVMGYGAASGLLRGTIKALFYRHRSVGGYDYVGDFLIAPEENAPSTRKGDSGMIWNLDLTQDPPPPQAPKPVAERDLRPLALEWGGQVFDEAGRRSAFAVATSLSNVCKLLDVELVTDQARGVSGYWGRTGHYSIAAFATELVADQTLKAFLQKNLGLLSFDLQTIQQKDFDKSIGELSANDEFVPLADVPDEIWKKLPADREGGRDTSGGGGRTNGPEHPTHYADIDAPFGPHGVSWRKMCLDDHDNVSAQAWLEFYKKIAQKEQDAGHEDLAKQYRSKLKQGLLPFRIWQFFDAMTDRVKEHDVVGYLAAAGLCAHYVGDASQPLHGSVLADGDPLHTVTRHHPRSGKTEKVKFGEGVHSAYETAMVSLKATELINEIRQLIHGPHGLTLRTSGKECAIATLKLMDKVATTLPPKDIVQSYESAGTGKSKATLNAMWDELGDGTAKVMFQGARTLALIWESAWTQGGGNAIAGSKLKKLSRPDVRARYIDPTFVPSLTLDKVGDVLK